MSLLNSLIHASMLSPPFGKDPSLAVTALHFCDHMLLAALLKHNSTSKDLSTLHVPYFRSPINSSEPRQHLCRQAKFNILVPTQDLSFFIHHTLLTLGRESVCVCLNNLNVPSSAKSLKHLHSFTNNTWKERSNIYLKEQSHMNYLLPCCWYS